MEELVVINYNGVILVGELLDIDEEEIALSGALSLEPTTQEHGGMRPSPFPLGSNFMYPDKEVKTRLRKSLVPCYTIFDLLNTNHEICQMYRSYWDL